MAFQYKRFPNNQNTLIEEIIDIFNAYDNNILGDDEFISIIKHYWKYTSNLFMEIGKNRHFQLSKNFESKIGKNRSERMYGIIRMFFDQYYENYEDSI